MMRQLRQNTRCLNRSYGNRVIVDVPSAKAWNGYGDTGCFRGGFTLVEMLVSVALVVLMMAMFASAFQIATGVMLRQRGVAENDQRARSVVTMLRGDLQKRTYRQRSDAITRTQFISANAALAGGETLWETNLDNTANRNAVGIVPLHPDYFIPGVGGSGREVDGPRESGYFYISENDPFNDADDVLQFTIFAGESDLGNTDTTPYTGRARPLGLTWGGGAAVNIDQPIWDDGIGFKVDNSTGIVGTYAAEDTGTSASPYAEVSIFIRNGNLMRRLMLIRQPQDDTGDEQPTRTFPPGPPSEFIPGDYRGPDTDGTILEDLSPTAIGTSDFWNDFDSSATRLDSPDVRMRFNVAADLDNASVTGARMALGNPRNRFGHDPTTSVLQGRPKEHLRPDRPDLFFGRYTHEETSHHLFQFPGTAGPLPFSPASVLSDTTPANGTVDQFEDGPREGEDILMPNVHAFDIKVWDAALGDWADIGHNRVKRDYNNDGNLSNDIPQRGDWHISRITGFNLLNGTDVPLPNSVGEWTTFGTFQNVQNVVFPFPSARRRMYRYGSLNGPNVNRVFDTWHPQFNFNTSNDALVADASETPLDDPPPFRPLWSDRDNFDLESAGVSPLRLVETIRGVRGNSIRFNRRMSPVVWTRDTAYDFPVPRSGADAYDPDVPPCRVFPVPREVGGPGSELYYPGHQSMFYQVVEVQQLDDRAGFTSGNSEPAWPAVAGEEVQDGEIRWRAVNNTIGLQAIQITIRFLDPTSQQMRQVTIIHPFVEL